MDLPKYALRHPAKKTMPPGPLNIRRSRPTSRYLTFRTDPQSSNRNIKSLDRDDEHFAREDDYMSDLLDKLKFLETSFHVEIEERLKSGTEDTFTQVSTHLASFNWKTPPTSPALMSDGSIGGAWSPGTRRKKRELQKSLQEKALGDLIMSDNKYHDFERNITGLKEWWAGNRVSWRKQRDVVEKIKLSMEALHIQMENADGNVARAQKELSYYREYDELKKQLLWFDERLQLMKAVKEQCKRIEGDIVQEEKMAERVLLERVWSTPQGFSFTISPEVKTDVTKALWWSRLGRGFPWWLQTAHDFMEYNVNSLKGYLDDLAEEKKKCEMKLEEQERTYTDFERTTRPGVDNMKSKSNIRHAISRKKIQDLGVRQKHRISEYGNPSEQIQNRQTREESMFAVRSKITILSGKHAQLNFGILDARRRIQTHEAYLKLLKRLLLIKGNWYTTVRLQNFVNNVHRTFYLLMQEMEVNRRFIEASEDETLSLDESMEALARMEDQFIYNERYYQQHQIIGDNIFVDIAKTTGPKEDGLMATVAIFELVIGDYEAIVSEIEVLVAQNRELQQWKVVIGDLRPDSPTVPLGISTENEKWGNIKTMPEAYSYLKTEYLTDIDGKTHPTWSILRMFFVSPDVAPSFSHLRPISGPEFVKLVNSFLETLISSQTLEAFVYYCQHEADELFQVSVWNGKVCAQKIGWELVDEMEIRGPSRRTLLRKPVHIDDLSNWLLNNQKRLLLVKQNRDILENEIFNILKRYYPKVKNLTLENVQESLSYLSQAGLFYRYAPTSAPNGEPILIRVDNGWHFNPGEARYPLFNEYNLPHPYFSDIRKAFDSKEGRAAVDWEYRKNPMMTEFALYHALKPVLRNISPVIKEHKFHLWLRWCDQNHDLFELHRNGELDFI